MTNVPRISESTCVIETRLSDFHLITVTVMRKTFKKICPIVINYRSYRDFSNETFKVSLVKNLSNELLVNYYDGLEIFFQNNYGYFKLIYSHKEEIC